jgi:hypothetical protein
MALLCPAMYVVPCYQQIANILNLRVDGEKKKFKSKNSSTRGWATFYNLKISEMALQNELAGSVFETPGLSEVVKVVYAP